MVNLINLFFILGTCFIAFFAVPVAAISYGDMDTAVKPGDDLFEYANGNWIAQHPVPSDLTSYSSVSEVQNSVNERERELIEESAANPSDNGFEQTLVGTFYTTALNETLADQVGIDPIRPDLEDIQAIENRQDLQNVTFSLMGRGITPFFSFYADEDPANSSMLMATIEQSGTSLPDREYYFRNDTESERIRDEFRDHAARMFMLINVSPEQADIDAATVLRIETLLANQSAPSHGYGKPDRRYFPCPVGRLQEVTDGIDWDGLVTSVNRTDLKVIDLYQPLYVRAVGDILKNEPLEDLKVFLTFSLLEYAAPYAGRDFEQENFNFYYRVLSGQKEMEPRWKRVIATMDQLMGGAIGKLYVEKYFSESQKEDVRTLVTNLKEVFRVRLANTSWMDPQTRKNSTDMIENMGVQIGYPERWGDYSSLDISDHSYLENILNISEYYYYAGIQIADTPSDPDTWYLSPQSVNAYYDTTRNKIVLPAGVLQPPFYDPAIDDAEKYGAIGAIIGHELVHGFDTPLRKIRINGTDVPLWSANDSARFDEVSRPLVSQYDAIEGMDGIYLNGTRTLSENAADLGGIIIAYDAWQKSRNSSLNETEKDTDEGSDTALTDEQRFFIAYAQAWRGTIRSEELRNMVLVEQHPWNRFRVNTIPFNLDQFYAAFPQIGASDLLFRNETERARIW
jgi:putative endopeptidase